MTAADQPTTEPSGEGLLAKHALLWAERWTEDIEPNFTDHWPPEEVAEMNQEVRDVAALIERTRLAPAPQPAADKCDGSGRCTAGLHVHGCFADLDGHCDDPDDHPATDTEAEVQWGVRSEMGVRGVVSLAQDEGAARSVALMFGATPVRRTVTRTPWEEA